MKINQSLKEQLEKNSNKATVTSAYSLAESEMASIKEAFSSLREAAIENKVDKKIIAGVIIKVGSLVIDLSFSSKLKYIYQSLYGNL